MKRLTLSITLASLACWPALDVAVQVPELEPRATSDIVRDVDDFVVPHAVPDHWRHLVDWHSGSSPVVLLFSMGGRACAISQWQAHDVNLGRPFRCNWSAPRSNSLTPNELLQSPRVSPRGGPNKDRQ